MFFVPVAGRWRSASAQPSVQPCHPLAGASEVQTGVTSAGKRQILNLAFPAFLRTKAFVFRLAPESPEMCLGTPSAAELITVAFLFT